jgi:hypothetical protein
MFESDVTTEEYWTLTVGEESFALNTLAWNITTFGGSRYSLPSYRGDNQAFAYLPGQQHHEKYADSRTISLSMWVAGKNPDGSFNPSQLVTFNDNFHRLRSLVWRPHSGLMTLTRRWKLTNSTTHEPETVSADIEVELAGPMEPTMTGRTRAEFSLDLLAPDPYFYGPEIVVNIPFNTPTNVYNPGDDIAGYRNFSIDLVGPEEGTALTNPKLTNSTISPNVWFRYERPIPDVGRNILAPTVTFDIEDFQVSPSYIPLQTVVHSGSRKWFRLDPGNNLITLTADGGTGSATIRFRPPYV